MKTLKGIMTVILCLGFIQSSFSELAFSGDVTGVSTFVWRGIKQYSGPALQGTAAFEYKCLTAGIWISSVAFGDIEVESDPFMEVALPTGSITSAIGLTLYSYDFLATFNDDADFEMEAYASVGFGPIGLGLYYVPSQKSTENSPNDSDYWIELSGKTTLCGADLGLVLSYGTYSSKFLAVPKEDAVTNIVLSIGKSLNEGLRFSHSYSLDLDDDMENIYFITITKEF